MVWLDHLQIHIWTKQELQKHQLVGAGDTEGAADDDDMADIRELRDEDFISDAEEEDFAGTNLESDEDQVPNMYGEEEYDN